MYVDSIHSYSIVRMVKKCWKSNQCSVKKIIFSFRNTAIGQIPLARKNFLCGVLFRYNKVLWNFTLSFRVIQPRNIKFSKKFFTKKIFLLVPVKNGTVKKIQDSHIFSSYLFCVKSLNPDCSDFLLILYQNYDSSIDQHIAWIIAVVPI